MVDPPQVVALRLALGVGPRSGEPPSEETFRRTYAVAIPLGNREGLDGDGVYEFDAVTLFRTIAVRSLAREWALRLELDIERTAEHLGTELQLVAPFEDGEAGLRLLDEPDSSNSAAPRPLVLGTTLVHDPKKVSVLSGVYAVTLRPNDGRSGARSLTRTVQVDLTRFEFEG